MVVSRPMVQNAITILAVGYSLWVVLAFPVQASQESEAGISVVLAEIDSLLHEQRWDPVIERTQALLLDPDTSRHSWLVHERQGLAWHGKGDFSAAVPQFEMAIRLAPRQASPHLNLATTLMALGHRGRAYAEYQQAVVLAPTEWRARLDYGQALLEFQMLKEARDQLLAAEAGCGDCPEVQKALARYYLQAADMEQAIPYLEQLHRAKPDSSVRANLAAAYWQTGADDQMVSLLQPYWPEGLSTGERIMMLEADRKRGRNTKALAAVSSWQKGACREDSPVFWGIVSLTCQESERLDEALVAVDRAIQLDPSNATYRNNRVVILTRLGRQLEAEAEWARVLELAPHLESNRKNPSP